jgi:mono/diheme cytochrome c family protein
MECHGGRNALGALSEMSSASGFVLPGSQWWAPSLAEAAGASVAQWSEAEVVGFLSTGRNDKAVARGPMAEVVLHGTQFLTPPDARAMARYLKTLSPGAATESAGPPASSASTDAKGRRLYETHCADCHGLQGQGHADAYPALAGNRAVTQTPANNLIHTVLGGGFAPATASNPQPYGMPPFLLQLGDAEIASVLSYIRNAWGNRAPAVSEFDINKLRRSQAP